MAKHKFYTIKNAFDRGVGVIEIFGEIRSSNWWDDENSIDYKGFKADFKKLEENFNTIEIHLHSVGGVIMEGLPIHDLITNSKAHTIGIVEGLAASISSVIFQACKERLMYKNARVMLHRASGGVWGDYQDILNYAENLLSLEDQLKNIFKEKTNQSEEILNGWFDGLDHFFNAEEAVSLGLADGITENSSFVLEEDSFNTKNQYKAFNSFKSVQSVNIMEKEKEQVIDTNNLLSVITEALNKKEADPEFLKKLEETEKRVNEVVKNQAEALEAAQKELEKMKLLSCTTLVQNAIDRGVIVKGAENKTFNFWVESAKNNFEATKEQLEALKTVPNFQDLINNENNVNTQKEVPAPTNKAEALAAYYEKQFPTAEAEKIEVNGIKIHR